MRDPDAATPATGPWEITYHYITNVDPATKLHTGLDPGWISLSIASSGEVRGTYSSAPIPSIPRREESYAMTISCERAEALRASLVASGYDATPGRTVFRMGEGQPVSVGLRVGGAQVRRAFTLDEVPAGLRPCLAQISALVMEIQAHVVASEPRA